MSEVHRYSVVRMLSEAGNKISYDPHGPEVVMAKDYDVLEAEAQALREERDKARVERDGVRTRMIAENDALRDEVAALRARAVVVPVRIADHEPKEEWYRTGWNACIDELARLNAKSISAETLRRIDLVLAALRSHDFHGIINSTIGKDWREQVAAMRGELRELLNEGKKS